MKAEKYLDKAVVSLDGKRNSTFEISVAGYEFPEVDASWDSYDQNWLNLSFRIRNDERDDSCTDACMLTYELEHFMNGIGEFLDSAEDTEYEPYFTENTFYAFFKKRKDGNINVTVEFYSEGKLSPSREWERFRFKKVASPRELRRAAKAMRIAATAFPPRNFE